MIVLLISLLVHISTSPINFSLPLLQKYEHAFPVQNFSVKNREIFKYQFESDGNPQVKIIDNNGKSTHNSCTFIPYHVDHELLAQYKLSLAQNNKWNTMKTNFAVVKFEHLIYTVSNSMELTAYSYTENQITKITTITLPVQKDDNVDSRAFLTLNNDESLLFLFSIYGVWRIQTHAVLTKIQKLNLNFDQTVFGAIHIGDWLLLSTMTNGIIIFQKKNKELLPVGAILDHQNMTIYPVDLAFNSKSGLLFVLDAIKNIYVYKMVEKGIFYYDVIDFHHSANFKISVVDDRIYYSFLEGNLMQIAELQYNQTSKSADLVRYYKEFDYVNDFLVDNQRLIVLSHETFDIYPAFIDPRLITNAHNGIRLQMKARKFQHIISDMYLFASQQSLKLIRLRSLRSHILCNFKTVKESISIEYKSNVSDCSNYSIISPKTSFSSYCEVTRVINIQINIPEQIQRQKILMYAIVIMVIMFFFAGLICLIQWRNGRLDIIDKLAYQIRRHKDKQKRTRQFVEENDIELPRSVFFNND